MASCNMTAAALPVVGLVGGIGSGKSSLIHWLAGRRHVAILDADRIGHAVLLQTGVREEIRQTFGPDVFDADGQIDRPRLGRLVFGDSPEQIRHRKALEAIVHPLIRAEIERQIADHQQQRDVDLILLDAAILLEAGWNSLCDLVVFIETPFALRAQRVVDTRGWNEDELRRREASQWPLEEKRAASDLSIDNTDSIDAAGERLLAVLAARFAAEESCTPQLVNVP